MSGRNPLRKRWPVGGSPAGHPARRDADGGAVSLEFALAVPVLFVLLLLIFHAGVYVRDAVLVQDAARHGARVAATTTDDAAVTAAVRSSLDGRPATVHIRPTGRRPGTTVRVTVSLRSRAGRGGPVVTASAAATVEPGVGG